MKSAKTFALGLSIILMMTAATPLVSAQAAHVRWDIIRRLPGTSLKVSDSRPLIDYATAAPFTIGFFETALAIEDSSNGIWR